MSDATMELKTPQGAFEALHKAADGRGKNATVAKADLKALLRDHSMMIRELQDLRITVTWPEGDKA